MPARVIDCHYFGQPQVAAAYLTHDRGEVAFVDDNTAHAVPRLLDALSAEGLAPEQVRWIAVTHAHLDHAGGTAALARRCPNATVLAHPRTARHLVDPSRLVASARRVYGDETFERLYPDITPIDGTRVKAMADGETAPLGGRTIRFLHTRGHANHHAVIHDEADGSLYSGDAFGLAYPHLQRAGLFVFPSTSPTDFDAGEARKSLDRIVEANPARVYLAHFGALTELEAARDQLRAHLDVAEAALEQAVRAPLPDEALDGFCLRALEPAFEVALIRRGLSLDAEERRFLRLDLELNAQGLAHVARKRRSGEA